MAALIARCVNCIKHFEIRCATYLRWTLWPREDEFALNWEALSPQPSEPLRIQKIDVLKDIVGNGFQWAVPTHRRTIEVRRKRWLSDSWRLKPRKDLVACLTCGHFYVHGTICGNCYEKVRRETEAMQEAIGNEWKCDAVDKEVVTIYENDPKEKEFWNGKRIVEMKRERPEWFPYNLRQRSNDSGSAENTLQPSKSIVTQVK